MERDEFVRGMIAALSSQQQNGAAWKSRERTAEEVFQQLCFDMPNVSQSDLETLASALRTLSMEGDDRGTGDCMRWFSLQPMVVENVLHLASQHQSASSSESAVQPLQFVASQLCATLLLEMPLFLLGRDKKDCVQLLNGYITAAPQPEQATEQERQSAVESALLADNTKEAENLHDDEHIYAAEEDPDDFVYEGDASQALRHANSLNAHNPGHQHQPVPPVAGSEQQARDYGWAEIEDAYLRLWRQLSYACLSAIDHSTWEALNLTSTLCQAIRALRQQHTSTEELLIHQLENKVELWSSCAFVLRERMVHYPQTIPTLLEALLRVLDSRIGNSQHGRRPKQVPVEEMISTSIVGSLCHAVQQPQQTRSRQYLQSFVSPNFDVLVDTIEQLFKEDIVSAADILCSCIGLVVDVDFENCKTLKVASTQQFDKLLTSRAVAVAITAFVNSIHTAVVTIDGALVAALKKLELTITGLTLLSQQVAEFVARFTAYVQLFATPGPATLHERVLVYIINPLVRMRVCLAVTMNAMPMPQPIASDTQTMLEDSIPIALNFDHAFARAAFTEDTSKTLQMLSGLAPNLFSFKTSQPLVGALLHDSLVTLLQRLRAWTGNVSDEQENDDGTAKTACYLSAATQAACIASLKSAISRLQGESSNKID